MVDQFNSSGARAFPPAQDHSSPEFLLVDSSRLLEQTLERIRCLSIAMLAFLPPSGRDLPGAVTSAITAADIARVRDMAEMIRGITWSDEEEITARLDLARSAIKSQGTASAGAFAHH